MSTTLGQVHAPFWYVLSICVLRTTHSLPFLFLDVPLILDAVYTPPPCWAALTHLFLAQGPCVPRGSWYSIYVLALRARCGSGWRPVFFHDDPFIIF